MHKLNGYVDIDKHIRRQNLKRYLLQCSLAGLVLNEWNFLTLLVILAGIISLSILKRLVLPVLMDLL